MVAFFVILYPRGDDMNITEFIKAHKEFDDLPFLVVFRTIQILRSKGMIKYVDGETCVGRVQSEQV